MADRLWTPVIIAQQIEYPFYPYTSKLPLWYRDKLLTASDYGNLVYNSRLAVMQFAKTWVELADIVLNKVRIKGIDIERSLLSEGLKGKIVVKNQGQRNGRIIHITEFVRHGISGWKDGTLDSWER